MNNRPKIEFWSSTEITGFLEGLIYALRSKGYDANHQFLVSSTAYRNPSSRLWLRFKQYVLYPIFIVFRLMIRDRANVVVVSTNTFYVPLLASFFHPQVIHLVYDLFPEALDVDSPRMTSSWKKQLCRVVLRRTLIRCKANVFLGEHLLKYAQSIYGNNWPNVVIEVGGDEDFFPVDQHLRHTSSGQSITIGYLGNLGRMHDLVTVVDCWQHADIASRFHWRFHCFGSRVSELRALRDELGEPIRGRISIGGGLAVEEWKQVLNTTPIALVLMKSGAEHVVFPSKTFSAMLAGCAILAIAPKQSDLAKLLFESDSGWVIEPGDWHELQELLTSLHENTDELERKRCNARSFAHQFLGQKTLAGRWVKLFESIESKSGSERS